MTEPAEAPEPAGLAHTRIAVIVGAGEIAHTEALHYVEALRGAASLIVVARTTTRNALRDAARERNLPFSHCDSPEEAVRMAHVCVVFGDCPFTERDIELLASQGVPVETKETKRRRDRSRGLA